MLASTARFELRGNGERQPRADARRAAKGGMTKPVYPTGDSTAGAFVGEELKRMLLGR